MCSRGNVKIFNQRWSVKKPQAYRSISSIGACVFNTFKGKEWIFMFWWSLLILLLLILKIFTQCFWLLNFLRFLRKISYLLYEFVHDQELRCNISAMLFFCSLVLFLKVCGWQRNTNESPEIMLPQWIFLFDWSFLNRQMVNKESSIILTFLYTFSWVTMQSTGPTVSLCYPYEGIFLFVFLFSVFKTLKEATVSVHRSTDISVSDGKIKQYFSTLEWIAI